MIDDLKPYPAYKDSGVPWLGEVPEHWSVKRLKSTVRNVIEQSAEWRSGELYLALENVESWTGRLRPTDSDIAFDSQVKRFRAGDVLFGKLRPYLAKVTRPATAGVCVGEFLVLRPDGADGSAPYLEQLLRSKPVIDAVNSSTFGAKMPRADWQFVGCMPITLPPLAEQSAIVRFLDHADRRIRRYIRANQKLLKLLEEYKQALIHRAVTGQIDVRTGKPYPAYKPSGVEWLGDVPEHWEVRKLRQCGSIAGGMTPSMADRSLWDGGVPWVTPKDMKYFTITGASMNVSTRALEVTSLRLIPAGSVLLVVRGMILARRVPIARTIRPVTINQDMKAIVTRPGIDAGYLAYRLDAAQAAFVPMIDEAGHGTKRFPTERWKDLTLAIPPVDEQRQLVDYLDSATIQVTEALETARREIDLLREFRTRLIADVVTGKLDVREAAARLPEEADEPEPLDEAEIESESQADDAGDAEAAPEEAEA
ncbi:MAG: restriction endonuclease subunit S [Casimicrobiaceae bacterium]|nr:restriction endonuclease subunit S [Casimicrobiaceae bacterium]